MVASRETYQAPIVALHAVNIDAGTCNVASESAGRGGIQNPPISVYGARYGAFPRSDGLRDGGDT